MLKNGNKMVEDGRFCVLTIFYPFLGDSLAIVGQDGSNDRKITRNQKRKHDEINHVQKTYDEMDPTTR